MNSGIYVITNRESDKIYIGSTNDFKRRWGEHQYALQQNKHVNSHLQSSWNKYGEKAFEFGVLEYLDNLDELVKAEQFWMDFYREEGRELYNFGLAADNPMRGLACNAEARHKISEALKGNQNASGYGRKLSEEHKRKISETNKGHPGWMLGRKHTEEAKHKISLARKGRKHSKKHRRKNSEAHKGNKHSDETRRKMSEAHRGRPSPLKGRSLSEEHKRKISEGLKRRKNRMAHNIYKESFVGSTPAWHGIGTVLGRGFSAEEAVKYGGLDFEVEKLPLFTQDGQQVDRFATVRTDLSVDNPDRILGVVGASYNIVQNKSVFSFFDEVVEVDQAIYDAVGALSGGKQIFITAKIPLDFYVAKDKFETYTVLTAGHTGMHALRVFCSAVRVVCQNTLNMALKQTKLSVSLRHTRNVHDRLLEAPAILGLVDSKFRETQALFQELANRPITVPLFNQYVEELFPSENPNTRTLAHRESVTLLLEDPLNTTPGIKHTWYSASQGVVQYADHMMPLRKGKDRFEQKMFGSGANLKKRAVDLATKYALEEA